MTSAITRAPAGAAHAHGFAKSLKGDAPSDAFEALFAAVAGAQPQPVTPPVAGETAGNGAEPGRSGGGAHDDDKASPQALLMAASMTLVTSDAKVDPRKAPAQDHSQIVASARASIAPRNPALENTGADSTLPKLTPASASQRIVPNATFVIPQPVAHALIAHKGRVAETPVPPTADPPRIARTPIASEPAAPATRQPPEPVGASVPSHTEAETLSPAPPSSPSETAVEHTRSNLSPRALVQAAMVEVVRSPGRLRMPAPDPANTDVQHAARPEPEARDAQATATMPGAVRNAAPAPAANAPVQRPSIVEQAAIADATATTAQPIVSPTPPAKASPTSRAAADIARQRQFALGSSSDAPTPADADTPAAAAPAFETLIALGKADGTLDGRAQTAPTTESTSPAAPSGAWLANLPAPTTTQALNTASAIATPRVFDQAAWSAALAQQVTASAIAATRETTVRITPDGLGPIEVRVRVASEHVDVRFAIEHPVTANMVREALPDLQRMLAQSGLRLGDAQVAQQNARDRGQAARDDASASPTGDDEPVAVGAAVGMRPRARVGLLDDFV
jgi:flagellar hook-length control protein FliK